MPKKKMSTLERLQSGKMNRQQRKELQQRLPGRKSDVQECQWLMKLHTYGLLRNSFRPPEEIRAVRTIWRLRDRFVQDAGRTIQQIQKALTTMNVRLANAISDVSGVTGMAIIRAILKGEGDPRVLAQLRDKRIQASGEEVARSLEGNWRDDVLFELEEVVECYDFYQQRVAACDEQLKGYMAALPDRKVESEKAAEGEPEVREGSQKSSKRRSKTRRKNQPSFDIEAELRRSFGVDLTRIDGIKIMTAQVIFSELGPDLRAFPSEGNFTSWLELTPRRDISGGKVIKQKSRESKNRVANALRMAAESLWQSDSYLGARYRQLRGRMEGKKAVKAMARYLACLVYRLLTRGQDYVDRGAAYYESKRAERDMIRLKRRATELGLKLVPTASTTRENQIAESTNAVSFRRDAETRRQARRSRISYRFVLPPRLSLRLSVSPVNIWWLARYRPRLRRRKSYLFQDRIHIVAGFGDVGDAAGLVHGRGTGVVGAQSHPDIALVLVQELLEECGAGFNVLPRVESIADAELAGGVGHQLHQALSAFRRNGAGAEGRLPLHHGAQQFRLKLVPFGGGIDHGRELGFGDRVAIGRRSFHGRRIGRRWIERTWRGGAPLFGHLGLFPHRFPLHGRGGALFRDSLLHWVDRRSARWYRRLCQRAQDEYEEGTQPLHYCTDRHVGREL
jgi:transposase